VDDQIILHHMAATNMAVGIPEMRTAMDMVGTLTMTDIIQTQSLNRARARALKQLQALRQLQVLHGLQTLTQLQVLYGLQASKRLQTLHQSQVLKQHGTVERIQVHIVKTLYLHPLPPPPPTIVSLHLHLHPLPIRTPSRILQLLTKHLTVRLYPARTHLRTQPLQLAKKASHRLLLHRLLVSRQA
jgi:hypothetical protein